MHLLRVHRSGRSRLAGGVVTALATAVLLAVPAAADPAVIVTPNSGLVSSQTVTVEAFELGADQLAGATQCRASGVPLGSGCATVHVAPSNSDGQGHFTLSMPVHRFISIDGGTIVDCAGAAEACSVVAVTIDGQTASQPLSFVPQGSPVPPTAAALTASPTSGLINGQRVTLAASAFTPGAPLLVELCATGADVCTSYGRFFYTDATGAFLGDFQVSSSVGDAPCATEGPCVLRATDITGVARSTSPLLFASPEPRILTVTPNTGLVDLQTVSVRGTGFIANATTGVAQCLPPVTGTEDCGALSVLTTDPSGAFSVTLTLRQVLTTQLGQTIDCASSDSACVVAAANASDIAGTVTVAPLSFGPPSPTSKSDCKNGGWRQLVDDQDRPFRNQGRCVAWAIFHAPG
jgi:hypothetical protein